MKTLKVYDELAIPSWALSYLVNDDSTGLSDQDQAQVDSFMADFEAEAKSLNAHVMFADDAEGGEFFTNSPEFGLPCNCVEAKILIMQ
jgi:hypothetical protein